MSLLHDAIVESMVATGYYVGTSIFDATLAHALCTRMHVLRQHERFRAARVGRGNAAILAPEIRGDAIAWLQPGEECEAEGAALLAVNALRMAMNAELYLGLSDSEFHYAHYPRGACYQRHLDRFGDHDLRVISLVFYLNPEWHADDGGELVIYDQNQRSIVRVLPLSGTMVAFRSELFPHEVLPAMRGRSALTGWMRRRALVGQ